jgi:predicted ATP-grasp superfamily ATP-dependent carboligase
MPTILVFEYIVGGGYSHDELPESLTREGLLMLKTLVAELSELSSVNITVMIDGRMLNFVEFSEPVNTVIVEQGSPYLPIFKRLLDTCDAVWPIAPETCGILGLLSEIIESSGKTLHNSTSNAVKLAGNKWLTYQRLCQHTIDTPITYLLSSFTYKNGEWMIKAIDGVGSCDSYYVNSLEAYLEVTNKLILGNYIIQAHIDGVATSLSCLFKNGTGHLLTVNLQQFDLVDKTYQLKQILVNFKKSDKDYQNIVDRIATAVPGLRGYVGIDLIEHRNGKVYILEINPRLTTSYAGIKKATGINIAECVIEINNKEVNVSPTMNSPITLTL